MVIPYNKYVIADGGFRGSPRCITPYPRNSFNINTETKCFYTRNEKCELNVFDELNHPFENKGVTGGFYGIINYSKQSNCENSKNVFIGSFEGDFEGIITIGENEYDIRLTGNANINKLEKH